VKRNVMVGVAVAAAVAIGVSAVAVATSGGGGGGQRGIVVVPKTVPAPAPTSPGGGATPTGPTVVPHNNVAATYNVFGADQADSALISLLSTQLKKEGYQVTSYADTTEGAGGHGGATLANFVGMAKRASVIIIIAHGDDNSGSRSAPCERQEPAPLSCPAPADSPRGIAVVPKPLTLVPTLQVEWYPTWQAEQRAYNSYIAQGYNRSWLFDPHVVYPPKPPTLATLLPWRPGDLPQLLPSGKYTFAYGARPWLGITAAGIAHFFKGRNVDLVDNLACRSMALAPSFDAKSYFGHATPACPQREYEDEPTLFNRLIGQAGVPARSTTAAMALGGFLDPNFQLAAKQPVVLSPAVESVDPLDTARVAAGRKTTLTVKFDAVMDTKSANDIVTASGCGGTLGNARWRGKDTLTVDLTVPKKPPNTTATLTMHHDKAHAPGDGDNQLLDGNTNPPSSTGYLPNGDDYTWTLSCDASPTQPSPTAIAPPGRCNPGDVELRVFIYGRNDIGMTYTEFGSKTVQTSWPAGNAPFPNSFPRYPAPYLRYGCFAQRTTVHLTFNNADEPWLLYSSTTGPTSTGGGVGSGCNISRKLKVGMQAGSAQLTIPRSCDVLMINNTDLNAYWVEPSYANNQLTAFAGFPRCLPENSTLPYCPPVGGN
jgi:hypothetical protein